MLFEFSEIKVPDKKSDLFDINTGFELGNMYECLYSSYKKYEPREIKAKNEREMLFLNILKLSFAINDLNLYLDIHPDDEKTYELFKKYCVLYQQCLTEYESKYQVLELFHDIYGKYTWYKGFPWEDKYV
ncbi:MAG: spore coat protein CotJB [Bacilli bacterium]|nr:spore coat protein CotJB [Bacilli bacterium]